MKTERILSYLVIGLLLFLWLKGCGNKETETRIVKVPAESGEFEPQEPVYLPSDTVYITKWKEVKVLTENPVNDSLAEAYTTALDSLERYKMFVDAIQIRQFENVFEDDNLKATVSGEVQGSLNSIVLKDYTIKEREIEVDNETTSLRILAGGGIGNTINLNDFTYRVNLGFQNAKGNTILGGWSRMNGNNYIFIDYNISILDF